ncbi:MAG: RNHCP domain-containing protein [Minisyncoccia bacterium]|jgi:hypothetical protein
MARRFERTKEDFICGNCGRSVHGNGYTNHCPACLWSRHVDVNPGDRAATCGGLMEPIGAEQKNGAWVILHRCVKCGFERKNKTVPEDDFDVMLRISTNPTSKI